MIAVERLGKRYRLHHQHARQTYVALRDVIAEAVRRPLGWLSSGASPDDVEEFWALKDVSFEVRQGEVLGIIGRNGAGKSTLLKILSRITEPTEGRVTMHGGAASLLEVGTGFHPELTGRDNIFLNGSILGMPRAEIARKFDEIVAFAGTERFLDTPVKRYSSGMYVRLAFAVAAHLEPDILIVDEVLAVGDAEFQQKCLGKMGEVAGSGRTVLFVSHQLATVENLCRSGLLLDRGRVTAMGPMRDVITAYSSTVGADTSHSFVDRPDRRGDGTLRFVEARLLDAGAAEVRALRCGASGTFELRLRNATGKLLRSVHVSVGVDNAIGQRVVTWSTTYAGGDFPVLPTGDSCVRIRLPRLALTPGSYKYHLFATVSGEIADWLVPGGGFEVEPGDFYGSGQLPGSRDGTFLAEHSIELAH
jgi:lipopolysaccharide transport system ATP-binding protein